MSHSLVVENEVVDEQCAARLQSLAKLPQDSEIIRRRFLMGDVSIDRIVVLLGAEVGRMEVAIDVFETVGDTEFADELLRDPVNQGPVELDARGLPVRAEPDRRADT